MATIIKPTLTLPRQPTSIKKISKNPFSMCPLWDLIYCLNGWFFAIAFFRKLGRIYDGYVRILDVRVGAVCVVWRLSDY